jgi:hypothetical protein
MNHIENSKGFINLLSNRIKSHDLGIKRCLASLNDLEVQVDIRGASFN